MHLLSTILGEKHRNSSLEVMQATKYQISAARDYSLLVLPPFYLYTTNVTTCHQLSCIANFIVFESIEIKYYMYAEMPNMADERVYRLNVM